MKRWAPLLLFLCLLASPVWAQNLTTVTASNIQDVSGAKLSSGALCFDASNATNSSSDTPSNEVSFQAGGGGQVLRGPICTPITTGAIGTFHVPNSADTIPAGVVYHVYVIQGSYHLLDYYQVSVTGTTWSFDTYNPNTPVGAVPSGASVNGPLTVNGDLAVTGSFTPGTLGNTSISGTLTVTGNGDAGNVSVKPNCGGVAGTDDGIRFVSVNGSDSNDGCSRGSAMLTIGAALSAIPANASDSGHGKIKVAAGTYQISSTLVLQAGTTVEGLAPASSPVIIQASASFPTGTPLIELGNSGQPEGVMLKNLKVDCNNISGAIGVQNDYSQEFSGTSGVTISDCPGTGLDLGSGSGSSAQGSTYTNTQIVADANCTNCSTSTLPISVTAVPKYISGLTINFTNASSHPSVGLNNSTGSGLSLRNAHCEGATTCYEVNTGAILVSVDCGSGSSSGAVTTCVDVNTGQNGYGIFGLSAGGNVTNLLVDNAQSITIPATATPIPFYMVGAGGSGQQNIWSSKNSVALSSVAGYRVSNSQYLISAGTITLSSGAGSHTFGTAYTSAPVCTASDETATSAVELKVTSSTTAITIAGNASDVIAWICTPGAN